MDCRSTTTTIRSNDREKGMHHSHNKGANQSNSTSITMNSLEMTNSCVGC